MTDCRFVEDALDSYLDDALTRSERVAIDEHLEHCESCARVVTRVRALEQQVASVVDEWSPSQRLQQRLASALESGAMMRHRRRRVVRWAPAFAVVLLLVGLGVFKLGPGSNPGMDGNLVSEFNTFVVSGRGLDYESARPDEVQAWFSDKVTFRPPVPGAPAGLSLAGARLCNVADKRVASYMYKVQDAWVSLYIMRSDGPERRSSRSVDGYAVLDWTDSGLRYVLVGDVARARLDELARSMGQRAHPLT